jgi:hypothetical protein
MLSKLVRSFLARKKQRQQQLQQQLHTAVVQKNTSKSRCWRTSKSAQLQQH